MAMMRRGGSAARVAFFGAAVSSMTAGGSMRPTARLATFIFAIS